MVISFPRRLASKLLATGLALLLPLSSHAFKLNTHLWVGQQVINDLEASNGKITIRLRGQNVQLPVRDDIRLAILQNKNEYLLGTIGPDAMPDVVVGQSLMHPGQANGWQANDWMQHLLQTSANNPPAKAFAYGYLAHASADVFAHTYVNQYAGDKFDLSNETLVEERHVALEGFIAKYTPQLTSYTGAALGNPWTVVRPSDAVANFLRDQLVYSPQAQAQYVNSPYAAHMVAFKEYRSAIDTIAEDGVWRDIDIAVAKFISTQFGYNLSTAQAAQVVDMIAKVNDKLNRGINVTQDELTALHTALNNLDLRLAQAAKAASDRAMSLEAGLISAQNDLEMLLVEKTCDQVALVCPSIDVPDGITCRWYGCWPTTKRVVEPVCKAAFERTCKDVTTILNLRNQATARLLENRKKVTAELLATHTELVKARESAVALANAMIDFVQIPTQGSSPIQAILRNWRADTDQAVSDYVKAASQAMINTMDPAASAFTPLQRWLECSYPSLVGIPAVVSGCGVRDSATQIVRSLDRLANLPTNVVATSIGLPTTAQIAALKARIEAQVTAKIKKKITGLLIDLLPEKVQGIVRVLDEDIDAARLNSYFTKPELGAPLGLVMIPDVSTRVIREMGAVNNGIFDAEKFAAVYDAVLLAKLALLDNAGLQQLAQYAGVPTAVFNGTDNMVANAFADIDGNHQWLDAAPLRPSVAGAADRRVNRPGYPSSTGYRTAAGFVPWQASVRDALFRGLFKGPLSPGVEAPSEIGATVILPASYPYMPCVFNPFPDDERDQRCIGHLTTWVPPVTPPPRPPVEPGCRTGPRCQIP